MALKNKLCALAGALEIAYLAGCSAMNPVAPARNEAGTSFYKEALSGLAAVPEQNLGQPIDCTPVSLIDTINKTLEMKLFFGVDSAVDKYFYTAYYGDSTNDTNIIVNTFDDSTESDWKGGKLLSTITKKYAGNGPYDFVLNLSRSKGMHNPTTFKAKINLSKPDGIKFYY